MHEDGQPVRLAHFVDSEAAEVVDLEALDVGVQLDAVQTQLSQMAVVADKVGTVGIERAEPEEATARCGDFGGDEFVDVPHLMRRGGDRFHDETVDAAGVCAAEQFFRRTAAGGFGAVEGADARGGAGGDFRGVDVAVCVYDAVSVVHDVS